MKDRTALYIVTAALAVTSASCVGFLFEIHTLQGTIQRLEVALGRSQDQVAALAEELTQRDEREVWLMEQVQGFSDDLAEQGRALQELAAGKKSLEGQVRGLRRQIRTLSSENAELKKAADPPKADSVEPQQANPTPPEAQTDLGIVSFRDRLIQKWNTEATRHTDECDEDHRLQQVASAVDSLDPADLRDSSFKRSTCDELPTAERCSEVKVCGVPFSIDIVKDPRKATTVDN